MGLLSDRRRHSGFYSRSTTINILRFLWIVLVVWCEVGAFFWSLSNCRWPDRAFRNVDKHASPSHVMILSDIHFRHSRTIAPATTSWVTSLAEFFIRLNLRKSWNAVSRLNPHLVIVLGDMLDKGRAIMTDEQYEQYYERFRETFSHDKYIQFYYVIGNHDVGLGSQRSFSGQARRRFRQRFGPEQQVFEFGNHTFVSIDAPALVDEDYRRHAAEVDFESWQGAKAGPISFVKAVKNNPPAENRPTILLSHIPLARTDAASCGPNREQARGIRRGAGFGFQNLLGKETTHFVLQSLKPVLVFSGDDHDYCDFIHRRGSDGDIREVTVRSFAMAEGINRPGFQLLSLYTPAVGSPRRADLPCLLPDQMRTYTLMYFPFFVISVFYLIFINATIATKTGSISSRKHTLQPLRMTPLSTDPPLTPSLLSVRRTASFQNFGPLTPRSRPSSPRPTSLIFSNNDDEDFILSVPGTPSAFPFPPSPLLPAPHLYSAEPDAMSDIGDDDDRPKPSNGGNGVLKRWLKSDRTTNGWRRWLARMLDATHLWWNLNGPRKGRGGTSDGVPMRVWKDLVQTAWPPLLVALFTWWRLFSW